MSPQTSATVWDEVHWNADTVHKRIVHFVSGFIDGLRTICENMAVFRSGQYTRARDMMLNELSALPRNEERWRENFFEIQQYRLYSSIKTSYVIKVYCEWQLKNSSAMHTTKVPQTFGYFETVPW